VVFTTPNNKKNLTNLKKSKSRPSGMVSQWVSRSPFPDHWDSVVRYSETIALASGVGGIMGSEFIFALNDAYDPNYSGVGHQPFGFDQLAAIYKRYLVLGAEIEIRFTNPNEDGETVASLLQGSAGTYTLATKQIAEVAENPQVEVKLYNATGNQLTTIRSGYIPFNRVEGISLPMYKGMADQYGALVTTDPTRIIYFRVALGSIVGSATASCQALVTIKMHTHFFERVSLGQS
jgi:hypothetical protein